MPGSGLGLAIVQQVVLKHGGALRIDETVPGANPPGTSIFMLLPGQPVPGADAALIPPVHGGDSMNTGKR